MIVAIKHILQRPLITMLVAAVLLTGCGTTYIEIQQEDTVAEFGQPKFSVTRGDVLKVVRSKICRTGQGECWEVINVKTREFGFVNAKSMKARHRVYRVSDSVQDAK